MSNKSIALAVVGVALFATIIVLWKTRSNDDGVVAADTPVPLKTGDSQDELASLETRIDDLRIELRALESQRTSAALPAPSDDTGNEAHPHAREHEPAAAVDPQQILATYESAFWDQDRDAAWGDETEATIRSAVATVPNVELLDVSCLSTMCRLEVYQPDDNFMDELPLTGPFLNRGFYHPTEDGRMIVYLARSGHRLPKT